jgi:Undecaprenyl-phosphate glucose phosphotransferase
VREAIAKNRVESRRAIIISTTSDHAPVERPLSDAGVTIVRSLPFPAPVGSGRRDNTGPLRRLVKTCRAARPDDILILTMAGDLAKSVSVADALSELPASVHIVPVDTAELFGSARLGELGALITIELNRPPLTKLQQILKRVFDIFAAVCGLILLSPLLLVVALAIKLGSRGPILFRQTRHGYNNDKIRVFKFRTMTTIEDGHVFTQAKKNDPRITRLGHFLRQSNIDELPQLLNVLIGDMSIVGPRPHPVALNQSFEEHIWPLSRRHNVKPGITGWAQVNGYRGETDTLEKMQRRFECDLYYIDNWSFLLDMKIIIMTIFSRSAYTNAF